MTKHSTFRFLVVSLLTLVVMVDVARAQYSVEWAQKVSAAEGGFGGSLDTLDEFGVAVAALGDFDGDGVGDLLVGAHNDDESGTNQGAVWILNLDAQGTVADETKIVGGSGGLALADGDHFGLGVADLGVLYPGAARTLAVGARGTNGAQNNMGAVWLVPIDTTGAVVGTASRRITENEGGFTGPLGNSSYFGTSVALVGALGTNTHVVAVGEPGHAVSNGAVWLLSLDSSLTVTSEVQIVNPVASADTFGLAVAHLGDLDGPGGGAAALAVGAPAADIGGVDRGTVWILFLDSNGGVQSTVEINELTCDGIELADFDRFGEAVANAGDLDGNGVDDLLVTTKPATATGVVHILLLDAAGSVVECAQVSTGPAAFAGGVVPADQYGRSVTRVLPGSAQVDADPLLSVGAYNDDDGAVRAGAVWNISLGDCATASWTTYCQGTSGTGGEPTIALASDPVLGSSTALLVSNESGAVTFGVVIIGLAPATLSGLGGTICVLPLPGNFVYFPHFPAGTTLPFTLPNDAAVCGVDLYLQAAYADPAGPTGKVLTKGLYMVPGS